MTPAARWGVVLLPQSLAGLPELCREVEEHGFDWLGIADSQSVFREMYVALTIAALNTSRVRLGPLVTNPLTRHLVVTASAISTIDETNVADTRRAAVDPIKMALAASANHAFRFTLEGKGVPPDLHEKIRALPREYDAHQHEIEGAGNARLTDRWGLTDFLVDRFAFAGTPEACAAQIRRAMDAGARQFMITGIVPVPRVFVRRWMREVVAAVR